MELLSNTNFDIKEYCGHIVLMYTSDNAPRISKLREMLDLSGYAYITMPIDKDIIKRHDFTEQTENILRGCACFVPVMSSELFESADPLYRSVFWYYIGYMRSGLQEAIVPFSVGDKKVDLAGTPLQGIDIMFDEGTFMKTVSGKFASKLLCNNYYENRSVNSYASKRIYYRCLRFRFKIYESAFRNAKAFYKEYTSRRMTDSAFDEYLADNLVCGCRLISFGTEQCMEPPMMPYKDEVHPYITDYPKTLIGKKSYSLLTDEDRERTGVRAELNMDVLLPVHKLLGTYFRPYFSCSDTDCPVFFLLALLEGDFTGKECEDYCSEVPEDTEYWRNIYPPTVFIDEQLGRFYFSSGLYNKNNVIRPDPNLKIGDWVDYIFPQ